ncbi:MAG: phage tail sheath family protein [Myxococcota bacterium]
MDYQTPGVYVREEDTGPKPIDAVSTSVPGFIGLFDFKPEIDAISITGKSGDLAISGKVLPQLVDTKGAIKGDAGAAAAAIQEAFGFQRSDVKDLKAFMAMHGHKATFGKGDGDNVKISVGRKSVEVHSSLVDTSGQVLAKEADALDTLFNRVEETFPMTEAAPATAGDLLGAYGFEFDTAVGTSMMDTYSVAPWAVTNKSEFFRWLQSFFAQYLCDTESTKSLVGEDIADPDDAADAVFAALSTNDKLKERFQQFLSQPSVFKFVAAVNGYYDNGGGKCYVYLMGSQDLEVSVRENQADKLGLYAFDDCDDMSIHCAPGLSPRQQKEMLEHCETRKDRFAILDGPVVSTGAMDIPASEKGYGAMYVPWVKVAKPSWFVGESDVSVTGPLSRKLVKAGRTELHVPPCGHVAGVYCRVDGERGVHKAPANEIVRGITGISQVINKLEHGQYNKRGINVIRDEGDRGVRIMGARTLATMSDASWKYLNVRRLFIMVEQSIMAGSQWAVFEPNDKFLWTKLKRDVRSFLMRVWRTGALFGATPEEAFFVQCDAETNPQYLIDAGQVNVRIGISPVKPAEFVVFNIGQWDGGASVGE